MTEPGKGFEPENPVINFGVAGAPATVRQIVFFTDDESAEADTDGNLEASRSWILETQSVQGEMWVEPSYSYYGDMQWYAAVTTADRQVHVAGATICTALERYYFGEQWAGELPEAISALIKQTIAELRANDGSRRGRRARPKIGARA